MKAQTFLVTGAGKSGIGVSVVEKILREGHRVYGTFESEDIDQAQQLLSKFSDGNNLVLTQVDHSSKESLSQFIKSAPSQLSGVVHAQFYFAMENPTHFDHSQWEKSIAINLTAPNYLTHELVPHMADGASVVVITSTEGFIGSFGASAYAATKAAIHNLVKTLANNLGHRTIRVNALAAGWIGGVMDTDEVFEMSRKITPLGRLGTPDEIASSVWFLLSAESSFVNATTLTVDGGYTAVDTIAKYELENYQKEANL